MISRIVQRHDGFWYAELFTWTDGWKAIDNTIDSVRFLNARERTLYGTWRSDRNKEKHCQHGSYAAALNSLCIYRKLEKRRKVKVQLSKYFWTNKSLENECDC